MMPVMIRRPKKPEYESTTHEFVATTPDAVLLRTVPTGKKVARAHVEAAVDVGASERVKRHFETVYNCYD